MDDLISRQAAIDAIGKTSDELYENIKKGATFPQRQWFDGMAQAQSILENLPSAQPEQRWIPCSERLPEKSGLYYVSGGGKVWICKFFAIPNFTSGWCNDASNHAVQAWMSLPEPYKGE